MFIKILLALALYLVVTCIFALEFSLFRLLDKIFKIESPEFYPDDVFIFSAEMMCVWSNFYLIKFSKEVDWSMMKYVSLITFVICTVYIGFVVLELLIKRKRGAEKEELKLFLKEELRNNGILFFIAIVSLLINNVM